MRVVKLLLVGGLIIGSAGSGWLLYAQQSKLPSTVSAQDYLEIDQLVKGYIKGIDVGPEDASWVFTPDGEMIAGNSRTSGEKALKQMYAGARKGRRPTQRHLLSNLIVTPSAEGARGLLYITTVEAVDKAKPLVTFFGYYEDIYVKTPLGWRIKRREFFMDAGSIGIVQP